MKLVKILYIVLCLAILGAPITAKVPVFAQKTPGAPIYFEVKVSAISPLVDNNASDYGLETPGGASTPVGQYFNVTIWLQNATLTNAPSGIQGIEVHLNISTFAHIGAKRVCEPVAFFSGLGQPGGVLIQNSTYTIIYAINPGYYDKNGNPCNGAMAAEYAVSAASTLGTWNASSGLVAWIQFQIMGAPSNSLGDPVFYAPIAISKADLSTTVVTPGGTEVQEVPFDVRGTWYTTLRINPVNYAYDSAPTLIIPTNGTMMKYSVGLGYGCNISATVKNLAAVSASFDVEYVANATAPTERVIGMTHVSSLATGSEVNVTITGSSTLIGVYSFNNISIRTEPVLGESNTTNNRIDLANSNFTVKPNCLIITIPGDMNGDKKAALADLSLLSKCWNKSVGDARYNPNCDIKNDGIDNLNDLSVLASNYNKPSW